MHHACYSHLLFPDLFSLKLCSTIFRICSTLIFQCIVEMDNCDHVSVAAHWWSSRSSLVSMYSLHTDQHWVRMSSSTLTQNVLLLHSIQLQKNFQLPVWKSCSRMCSQLTSTWNLVWNSTTMSGWGWIVTWIC